MDKVKTVAIATVVACIVLAASMIGIYFNFTAVIEQQSDIIKVQGDQMREYKSAADEMTDQIEELWLKINQHEETANDLNAKVDNLEQDMRYFQLPY